MQDNRIIPFEGICKKNQRQRIRMQMPFILSLHNEAWVPLIHEIHTGEQGEENVDFIKGMKDMDRYISKYGSVID